MRSLNKNLKGFTLTEMIISIGIFGLILGTSLSALSQGMFISTNSRLESEATAFLSNEMEILRAMPWTSIESMDPKSTFEGKSINSTITGIRFKTMRQTDQYELKLTVSWLNSQKKPRTLSAVTMMSKNGVGQ